ncbi:hypothetical protein TNIN_309051 [Trichonephila inaurata madagascariensis]|uniref:Uncharacterized protein n=1 Tax=Trichonephila inaurata madagascariensis TaxID=2747483 RepID=A0A8X6YJR9_9ARAC|nr:hypothetical protein TNIN_309051 [Trichonephila inaurata madagascariensis]
MGPSALILNRVKRNKSRALMGRGEDRRFHNKTTRHAFWKTLNHGCYSNFERVFHFRYGLGGHRGPGGGNGVRAHLYPRQRTHGLGGYPSSKSFPKGPKGKPQPVEFKLNVPLQNEAGTPASKKVSPPPNLTSLQEIATPPQPKNVSAPLEPKPNPSLQVKLIPPTSQKVSPFFFPSLSGTKIRPKAGKGIPEVSAPTDRVILKARRPAPPRI